MKKERKLDIVRKILVATVVAVVLLEMGMLTAIAEDQSPPMAPRDHFPAWMIDESYYLGAIYPISVEEVRCEAKFHKAGEVVKIETLNGTWRSALGERDACGGELPTGRWRTHTWEDELTSEKTMIALMTPSRHTMNRSGYFDTPELGIQCRDNTLGIYVYTGGYVAENVWTDRIAVAYRFGDGDVIEQGWRELISGGDSNVGAWMPSGYRRGFVNRLRANPDAGLTFRLWNYDQTEVGTMTFNLEGVKRMVEPVLKECGW